MNKILTVSGLLLLLGVAACEKNSDTTLPLAVDNRTVTLDKDAKKPTKFNIWTTGEWTARFREKVDWASLERLSGAGNGAIWLYYAPNPDIVRRVEVIVEAESLADTIVFTQPGAHEPAMSFTGAQTVEAGATEAVFGFSTTLGNHLDEIETAVTYQKYLFDDEDDEDVAEPETGWVRDIRLGQESVTVTLSPNTGDRPRRATLNLTFVSVEGRKYTTSSGLLQMNP